MPSGHDILRIFWPTEALYSEKRGVIVGWRNSDTDLVVISVLEDVELQNVDHALRVGHLFRKCVHPISRIYDLCGQRTLTVLGTTNGVTPDKLDLRNLSVSTNGRVSPIVLVSGSLMFEVQIVLYQRPSSYYMQYMSLIPISLALAGEETSLSENETEMYLAEKMKLHTVSRKVPTVQELAIPTILNQINCSQELAELMQRNLGLVSKPRARNSSVTERVVESAHSAWTSVFYWAASTWSVWIWPFATQSFKLLILGLRVLAEIPLRGMEWQFRADSLSLKDMSVTAQQIDLRLQQFCYWPLQYRKLRSRKDNWKSITSGHPEYIRFYNSLWLVANDIIIGIAVGSLLIDNADYFAAILDGCLSQWTVTGFRSVIEWLTNWPAGLKLNNELADFLADLLLWVIEHWSYLLDFLRPFLPRLIRFVGLSSFAGATLPIALVSDLSDLLTAHAYAFYIASARIFHWQLTIIISLFHLFRGKKNNVLRKRIDSCDYDLDQLLLGTILFTLLAFLLPTVLVFYLTFACSRMGMITIKAGLETVLTFLNHFPLFALMLRLKDPKRLPGGICFELHSPYLTSGGHERQADTQSIYMILKSMPLSLRQIFDQYFRLSARLRQHYLAPSVLFRLLTGRFVPPIHRKSLYSLQYSMLPMHRPSIGETWNQLNRLDNSKEKPYVSQSAEQTMSKLDSAE